MKKYRHHSLEYKQRILSELETGLKSKALLAREEKISPSLIDRWRKQSLTGTLRDYPTPKERQLEKELDRYKKKVGELTLENDLLKKIADYSARMRKLNGSVVTERNVERLRRDVK